MVMNETDVQWLVGKVMIFCKRMELSLEESVLNRVRDKRGVCFNIYF